MGRKNTDPNTVSATCLGTELSVQVYNEIIHSALILWHTLPLDGCVFSCEKSPIMSARAPPCRILNFIKQISKFKRLGLSVGKIKLIDAVSLLASLCQQIVLKGFVVCLTVCGELLGTKAKMLLQRSFVLG